MLSSIHPLGERARRSRWWLTTAAYIAGSLAGGVALGAAAGITGWLLLAQAVHWSPNGIVIVSVCVITALLEAAAGRIRLPSWRRQVNEDWLSRYRGWVYGIGFGFQLGAGVLTIITTVAVYAVVLLAFLTRSPAAGALIGAVFGLARAAPVAGLAGVRRPDQLRRVHARVAATAVPLRRASSSLLALAAVGAWWAR